MILTARHKYLGLLFGLLGVVHATALAGEPVAKIFVDGFELPNRYIDVSAAANRLCVVDVVGNLRCAEPPGVDDYPDFLAGRFVDLAGTEFGICVRGADDAVTCFGPDPVVPAPGYEALISGTAGFLSDLQNSICAPDGGSTTIHCAGDGPPAGLAVNDFATSNPSDSENRACWAPVTGGMDCRINGGSSVSLGSSVFEEVAVGGEGEEAVVCGLSDGAPQCYALQTGLQTPISAGLDSALTKLTADRWGSFCGLRGDGELVCWTIETLADQSLIVRNRGTDARLANIETNAVSYGATCGIGLDQKIECWGLSFAGAGIAPPGAGWSGVHSAGGTMAWAHPDRSPSFRGRFSDQLRSADGFQPYVEQTLSSALAACGLRDGEFRCVNGTDRWNVPEGPWLDIAVSRVEPRSWCGIAIDNGLVCETRAPGSQLASAPAGEFTAVALFVDASSPGPEETAYALAVDGSVACWGTSGPCSAASFTDFVRISKDSAIAVGLRENGDVVSLSSGSFVAASESFVRFRGAFGFRADDSFAWWAFPDRAVPTGAYLDAAAPAIGFGSIQIHVGPGPEATAVDGCAVRVDGGVDCWRDDGGTPVIEFQVAGNYRQIHRSVGLMLTDAAGNSLTSAGADLGSVLTPAAEYLGRFGVACMVDLAGRLGCKAASMNGTEPFNQTTGAYKGLALDSSRLCALNPLDRVECWSLFGTSSLSFSDQAFRRVAVGTGHACAETQSGTLIECVGGNTLNPLPTNPFPLLQQGAYRDLATSALATCVILPDGVVDCAAASFLDTTLPDPAARYTRIEIEAFASRFCLIRESGTIECFDRDQSGAALELVFTAPGAYTDVALYESGICALDSTGTGRCWSIEAQLAEWNIDGPEI